MTENVVEQTIIQKLGDLKYTYGPGIRYRAALETNFRKMFEALYRLKDTDGELQWLQDELMYSDVFAAARMLRERNSFNPNFEKCLFIMDRKDFAA